MRDKETGRKEERETERKSARYLQRARECETKREKERATDRKTERDINRDRQLERQEREDVVSAICILSSQLENCAIVILNLRL